MLGGVSYRAVLERGFALVRDPGNRPIVQGRWALKFVSVILFVDTRKTI
jgi:hypothetical protein